MQLSLSVTEKSKIPTILDETKIWKKLNREVKSFPPPNTEIIPGIKWGDYVQLFTPAYWKIQYLIHEEKEFEVNYRLGEDLLEEVVACLLGGFGLKAEIGLAAFDRLKTRGHIKPGVSFEIIRDSLLEPLMVNNNKVRYRFPNQKAKFISDFLNHPNLADIPVENDLVLRSWLVSLNGIGLKTASWITRNFMDSEQVAIIDVHIIRAFISMGLFSKDLNLQKDYIKLEELFLLFCKKLKVRPSKMDTIIWLQMKESGKRLLPSLNT
jgi:N-glycosylase/DNA lyase